MSLREVGLLVYSQGFAISREEYIIRELAFCDWTGHHHVLFKYTLPLGLTYDLLSEDAKTRVDRQTKTAHGLPLNRFCRITTYMNFIPTISKGTMSPAGVNNMSPPNDGGWVSSPSMVSIECSKSHGFLTRSSSWKGRDAGT